MTDSGVGADADGGVGADADGVLAPRLLTGLRVAVTRSVDRAGGLLAALDAAGAEPVLVPLIDFEVGDQDALGSAVRRLAAGEYTWLVISSITTLRALKQWCENAGTSLAELVPASTSVATIGPTSVAVLAAEGIEAVLAPTELQSAAGLVELWPEFTGSGSPARNAMPANKVLLPQSNLAEPTLAGGLAAKGWYPEVVTAYMTVDYPARQGFRLTSSLRHSRPTTAASHPLLTPAEAAGEIATGAIDAVVLASGSAARRTAQAFSPLPVSCLLVAIGEPTRREAERLGLHVAATAVHPTPEGIVAALARARTTLHNQ